MIYRESILHVADNSGALLIKCIGILGGTSKKFAVVGDEIVCSVISIKSGLKTTKIQKGEVKRAIIIRTVNGIRRNDGSRISFSHNSAILLDSSGKPCGTRISGSVPRELQRNTALSKFLSAAKEVV